MLPGPVLIKPVKEPAPRSPCEKPALSAPERPSREGSARSVSGPSLSELALRGATEANGKRVILVTEDTFGVKDRVGLACWPHMEMVKPELHPGLICRL